MTFGYQCDEETSIAIMDAAADADVSFIDTADIYPLGAGWDMAGRTEEIVGRWLRGKRDQYIVATKCWAKTGPRPWQQGNSRANIMRSIDESLRRLQTDYVDLYQLHMFDPGTPIDESLQALDDLVTMGKVRYVGCSNFQAYQVARAIGRSEVLDAARFDSVQPRYNLLFRNHESELLKLCAEEQIAVIPYNPLAGGMLTGKHQRGAPTDGGRFTLGNAADRYQGRYWRDQMFDGVEAIRPLADEAGVSMATLAMQWVLANPVITSPIIGASRPEQLRDAFIAAEQPIDPALKQRLDDLTADFRHSPGGI
jgi:aryl-alcohol dehydrogenase (NADP+)